MVITLVIIGITVGVSLMAFNNSRLLNDLILWPPAIERSKQYYRLVTYGFIHADFGHLFANMFTLFFFGMQMEKLYTRALGTFGFPLFYLAAIIVSILPTYLKNRHNANYRSLGASGAVSAVLFAFILLSPWSRIFVVFIPMPAIIYAVLYVMYSIYMERQANDNINHSAHLWGAAFGILFTIFIAPGVLPHFLEQIGRPRF
ncbi:MULTISPECIES: rhomboid family intramembrane serine protease [Dyella]|uniref:Rhomboid family intramembrane serine protease n=2 Tax=Dyella TaxID=231454 RepID=A0A4R0Z212_9GAMM|nr:MULTISPECIES: rhomboid family intramembrane serine protease [Dyella]TBR38951.1 rhomboid family intramembrane serine protease [Dyella terrae]TCI13458.1 rhomboid family intramembrane serine protease [Dyella soli]